MYVIFDFWAALILCLFLVCIIACLGSLLWKAGHERGWDEGHRNGWNDYEYMSQAKRDNE